MYLKPGAIYLIIDQLSLINGTGDAQITPIFCLTFKARKKHSVLWKNGISHLYLKLAAIYLIINQLSLNYHQLRYL